MIRRLRPTPGSPAIDHDPAAAVLGPAQRPAQGAELQVAADEPQRLPLVQRRRARGGGSAGPAAAPSRQRRRRGAAASPWRPRAPTDRNTFAGPAVGEQPHHVGDEDLAGLGGRAQAGRLDHREAEHVAVGLAGHVADARRRPAGRPPGRRRPPAARRWQRPLRRRAAAEGGQQPVAQALDHGPAVLGDGGAGRRAPTGRGGLASTSLSGAALGRTHQVGHEDCDEGGVRLVGHGVKLGQ